MLLTYNEVSYVLGMELTDRYDEGRYADKLMFKEIK